MLTDVSIPTSSAPSEAVSGPGSDGLIEAPLVVATVEPGTSRMVVRLWSLLILGIGGGMLGLGVWMTPSPHGLGTHAANLYLPPCGLYATTGIPCPTCGCTTAVTWLAHGHLLQAFYVQPFGAVVGIVALAAAMLGLLGVIAGRWYGPQLFTLQWYWQKLLVGTGTILGLAWIYKIVMVMVVGSR